MISVICLMRAPKSTQNGPSNGSKLTPKRTSKRTQNAPFKKTTSDKAKTL